jgi:hypothetical protein
LQEAGLFQIERVRIVSSGGEDGLTGALDQIE